ncbi:MAG: hypothetical protein ACK4XY_01310 [Chloroherpetonaceae bacterium]
MNTKVRNYLIEIAKQKKTITYSELSKACQLGLKMDSEADRQRIGAILDEISTNEHNEGRPLLSAVVVKQASGEPGEGFYKLAESLKGYPSFWKDELKKVHDYWKR